MIDERTVACVAQRASSDGFSKGYLLNTDTEKFTLSGTLQVKASEEINDICHVRTTDGTVCLLLSFPFKNLVQSIEMSGREVRWQVDKKVMGDTFFPFSICTDGSTAFILNTFEYKLHLLSAEDGSVLKATSLYPFDIDVPCYISLREEHLYIGHMNEKGDTYCVSKFTKSAI